MNGFRPIGGMFSLAAAGTRGPAARRMTTGLLDVASAVWSLATAGTLALAWRAS